MRTIYWPAIIALCLMVSCKDSKNEKQKEEMGHAPATATEIYVDTLVLHPQTFHRQLICNGKLKAIAKSDLAFSTGGKVTAIHVRNGQYVKKGQLIAETDKRSYQLEIEKSKKDLDKAKVELADKLIGLGYNSSGNDAPADMLDRAKTMSGYYSSQLALQTAQKNLSDCYLRAPFSGRIADLKNNRYQTMDKICTLINDNYFDVEFSVMEAELKNIRRGQQVNVTPFIDNSFTLTGTVQNINPTVDDKGLIQVTARVKNANGRLIDGMNVKVIIENDVSNAFVVPKDAVVERDGYNVVFTYKDGVAVWTYIDIAYSNLSSHAITGNERKETHVNDGDIIITSGNLNLADGTKVKARKKAMQ